MSNQVASTILDQLGGHRFIAMTGAHDFLAHGDVLIFKLGRNAATINRVSIEYNNETDNYNMVFLRTKWLTCPRGVKTHNIKEVKRYDGIYFDQLEELFSETTGLATRL